MFTGFKLEIDENKFIEQFVESNQTFEHYRCIGENHLNEQKAQIKEDLSKYVVEGGVIDGTSLENNWFPQVDADIFISHSHGDKEVVQALAGWIFEKFDVKCFIDSCVWGYIDKLLENLNSKYSNKRVTSDGALYSHEKCNIAASHVNMMLNISLQKMIDRTETMILINTPNSIKKYDGNEESTFSPWIYSEIVCSQIINKKKLNEYRKGSQIEISMNEQFQDNSELILKYNVSLEHLIDLKCDDLIKWKQAWDKYKSVNKYALDQLYKIKNPTIFKNISDSDDKLISKKEDIFIY